MKRTMTALLILSLAVCLLPGCGGAVPDSDEGKLNVISVNFPGYDFAREIAGDNVKLSMLLPPGSESHSFEPTTQDIINMQNCDLFIYGGGQSNAWVDDILSSMSPPPKTVLCMIDLVEAMKEEIKEGMQEEAHDTEAETGDIAYDEHVWTSPLNAIRITQAISDALCALDANNAEVYRSNTAAYIEQLESLDASSRAVTQNAVRNTLIIADRFPFRYFVEEYGLDYYAAFPGCSGETEASAKTVAGLIDKVNAEHIPVVFYIEFSNEKMADILCESTGAKKLLLHSCHNVSKNDFKSGVSYLTLMTRNIENLREALS